MTVTINTNSVDISSPNLTGADTIQLYYSYNCGEEQQEIINPASVVNNTFTWNKVLGDGVHFFRLIITGDINATELRTVVKIPENWSCDLAKMMDWEYMLQLWALEELTCDCYPENYCTIYNNLEAIINEC